MSVICPTCGREFEGAKLNARHLSLCNPSQKLEISPCLCGHVSSSNTQMKRHKKSCSIWQSRDVNAVRAERQKQTSLSLYGVEDAKQHPDAIARRKQTMIERYGAENPFCKDASTFQKVQDSLEGKRPILKGADNPFAWKEVKEKIKISMKEKYGATSPQQVPEIRERTRQTNLERYGVEETLACPEIRERIKATCEAVYGGSAPSCSPVVQAKQQETNMTRWGVPWTAMNPDVRKKQLDAMEEHYGSHYFASEQGKKEIQEAMLNQYGVKHYMQSEGAWDKLKKVFQEKYGVDHPLQLEYFNEKRYQTCIERYGTPFPGLRLHGQGMNNFEKQVAQLAPEFMFVGDGQYWKRLPLLGVYKNPDFILPCNDSKHPKRDVLKVIEAFGDFWHSRIFTGKSNFDHEQELIFAYADIGISCLIIWQSELKTDANAVAERIREFVASPPLPLKEESSNV